MWPKVDWASCRETEKPLRPDEELQPWGGGGGGEAACHPHHRQAVGSCGQDLREPGKDGPATFCHRCQCGGSSEDFPGKLCASSHIAPMMHSKIKGNIGHARFLVYCYRVHYVGLHPLCGALRGPWRCWGFHHWGGSGADPQVVFEKNLQTRSYQLQKYLTKVWSNLSCVVGLRSSWRSGSQSEPRSPSTPSSPTLRSKNTRSARCRRFSPRWSGGGSCSTGCRGRCSTGSSRLDKILIAYQLLSSVYMQLQFNVYMISIVYQCFILLIWLWRPRKLRYYSFNSSET